MIKYALLIVLAAACDESPPTATANTTAASNPVAEAKPPSTGKEMPPPTSPTISIEQARSHIAEAIALMGKPNPPCEKIVDALIVALPVVYPQGLTKAAIPAVQVVARCAGKTKRWRAGLGAATTLLDLGDDTEQVPPSVVHALMEMGEYDKAIKTGLELAKKYPKSGRRLMAATTLVYCRAEAWDRCVSLADKALAELRSMREDPTSSSMRTLLLSRALGWIVTGKPKEALADIAAIEKAHGPVPGFGPAKAAAQRAVDQGFYFEAIPVPQLPLGVYHLMGRAETGALVTFKLREQAKIARQFRVEVEVPGVTERSSNLMSLAPNEYSVKWANPPLKMDLDITKVRSPRPSQLHIKIVELAKQGERIVIDETVPIEVLPRDYLPLRRKVSADALVPTYGFLGAWVTSNDKSIEAFLTKAKDRVPNRSFVGEQDVTIPQVKALYDELKQRGVSYVMDPSVTSEQHFVQRTRLPAEVLVSTNAQCLESTLLFATLLEAIGIQPLVVFVPGHAFVGWKTVAKDGTKGEPLFVETTMVGVADFEAAVRVATQRVAAEVKQRAFETGASTLIDLGTIRTAGFTAQPF